MPNFQISIPVRVPVIAPDKDTAIASAYAVLEQAGIERVEGETITVAEVTTIDPAITELLHSNPWDTPKDA